MASGSITSAAPYFTFVAVHRTINYYTWDAVTGTIIYLDDGTVYAQKYTRTITFEKPTSTSVLVGVNCDDSIENLDGPITVDMSYTESDVVITLTCWVQELPSTIEMDFIFI